MAEAPILIGGDPSFPEQREPCAGLSAILAKVDWNGVLLKLWSIALPLAAAYCASKPSLFWAVPAITQAAGLSPSAIRTSSPPIKKV